MTESIVLMTDEKTRKSFAAMSAEDAGYILKGLLQHAAGEEVDDTDWSPLAQAVYPLIEGQVDRMTQLREKRSASGRTGGEAKASNAVANAQQTVANDQQKVAPVPVPVPVPEPVPDKKESPSVIRKSAPRFVPPTIDEVQSYVVEHGLHVDAKRFVAFYARRGWMVGKDKMQNWHQTIADWESRDRPPEQKSFGRDRIDYDAEIAAMYAQGG